MIHPLLHPALTCGTVVIDEDMTSDVRNTLSLMLNIESGHPDGVRGDFALHREVSSSGLQMIPLPSRLPLYISLDRGKSPTLAHEISPYRLPGLGSASLLLLDNFDCLLSTSC